jgi:hypothetical protein
LGCVVYEIDRSLRLLTRHARFNRTATVHSGTTSGAMGRTCARLYRLDNFHFDHSRHHLSLRNNSVYLMDGLAEMARNIKSKAETPGLKWLPPKALSIYSELTDRLVGTPRFLFDKNAISTAVELTLGRPKVMLEAMLNCRIPYTKLWVEWDESGREELRRRFAGYIGADRPLPDRVGFLLECDSNGRKGQAIWVWSALHDPTPNIGAFAPFFDLDSRFKQPPNREAGVLAGNVAQQWINNPVQQQAYLEIWRTAEHKPEGDWAVEHLIHLLKRQGEEGLANAMSDVYGEYIQMWACLLLLTSSRKIVDYTPVSMTRLNKQRVKQHKIPRLDHTLVTLYLDPVERELDCRAVHARQW